jgi:hypothetical protein
MSSVSILVVLLGDVVYQKGTDGTAVVGSGDGPEVLLSCRVPHLELDCLALYFHDS